MTSEDMRDITRFLRESKPICKICQQPRDPVELFVYFDATIEYLCKMCHDKIIGTTKNYE